MGVIAARHGLDTASLEPFAGGSDVVWACGDRVVKLTDPRCSWQLAAEADWLERLAGRTSLATPRLIDMGELEGWPYLVLSLLPGRALGEFWPALPYDERRRLAADIGNFIAELHGVDPSDAPRTWPDFWTDCRERAPVRDLGDPRLPDWARPLAEEVGSFLEAEGPLDAQRHVCLHTELLDQHLFARERAGRVELCGVLDFADGRVGPAEYDFPPLADFVFRGEGDLLRTCLEAYGRPGVELNHGLARRLLAWGLSHRFGRLQRMLAAVAPSRPRTLDELATLLFGLD
ncbi:Phosphotransferase enzyme family protein [Planctomycetes bacterium Pla86]|uniref:Phosphotransferase enzyme family protein n=2 Tax=Engelhardtia mirabilis TaxID=2528011 RepID=A0A518BM27_9BACT|nr:Phosphotransferase enzyme family protein [Planctomycetes bacterium Pla133]QDV02361.1 Phosphotransferase enzyme family protein [Planctomycetes bacterium Pla86]